MRCRETPDAHHRSSPITRFPIRSGLFEAVPRNVIVLPVLFEDRVKAVIELASLSAFTASHLAFLEQLTASIGIVLNSIEATMQTEGLLKQSQQLATELQTQQKELQQTNEQLAQKAQQLAEQNVEVERKNQEIEQARRALEDKAKELALTSKYKSEFLANMSHELRTPLNSILVLGQQLTDNPDGNLTAKQVEFARTIHGAGTDLLNLISDILDLVEDRIGNGFRRGRRVVLRQCAGYGGAAVPSRGGKPASSLSKCRRDPHLSRSLVTDSKRLQQVLKNLLSNAFKFTEQGGVRLSVSVPTAGGATDHPILNGAASVVAFEVADTGIGIPSDKQRIIFEAFQQADAGTSRKYGGTGLGPGHQPRIGQPAGWRNSTAQHARQGQHIHPLSAADLRRARRHAGLRPRTVAQQLLLPAAVASVRWNRAAVERIEDDRENLQPDDAVLLIVEDDPHYARVLCDLRATKDSKCWWRCAEPKHWRWRASIHPTAVSLDVFLPDMLGWTVLNHLKQDPATRHIPVQMLTLDEDRHHGWRAGRSPSSPSRPRLKNWKQPYRASRNTRRHGASGFWWSKIIRPNSSASVELLGYDDIDVTVAATGAEALKVR